jgi:hypothetical protein
VGCESYKGVFFLWKNVHKVAIFQGEENLNLPNLDNSF